MDIPHILSEQVREGRAVLFLGSGAAKGAIHPDSKSPPDARQLADLIAAKYLGASHMGRALDQVASLAISETNLVTVQDFVADIFRPFAPATFHKLIPTFVWSAIVTTNYDLLVERAYTDVANRCQTLVPFIKNGQHVEDLMREPSSLMFIKLHGCISSTNDTQIPLILTPEQYIDHREGRSRLFDRFISLAHERPIIFAGHSIADTDLRAILLELSKLQHAMPRSYFVAPNITDADERYWGTRKITALRGTFAEFMVALDSSSDPKTRKLAIQLASAEHPICRHLSISTAATLSASLLRLIGPATDFVHGGIASEQVDPKLFYKGYCSSWSPIVLHLDANRNITNTILLDYVAPSEEERTTPQELIVVKGHAGSGKSVLLRRIAWEASSPTFDRVCLYVKDGTRVEYDALSELHTLSRKRLFLFIEPASDHRDVIQTIVSRARRDAVPITIITAERHNEWSARCGSLERYVSDEYELRYLSAAEINELITLLERHGSLNHLESLSPTERQQALSERAGRNLLVALHEATLGLPFSDIILDEYTSIPDDEAKTLYRAVCTLHRLNVRVRAGVLSRVHGLSLMDFRDRLFRPLENIVFVRENEGGRDHSYESRHPHIAEMLFERVLVTPSARLQEYLRLIDGLDVDYDSDRIALRGLANAKELRTLFPDLSMVREVFAAARRRDPENAMLLHQQALAEMPDNLSGARELLLQARTMKPNSGAIEHSIAELSFKFSVVAHHPVEKTRYREEARSTARAIMSRGTPTSHPYHTLLKLGQDELEEILPDADDTAIATRAGEMERLLLDARQRFPDDSYLLEAEAKLSETLQRFPRAMGALQRAFIKNKASGFLASRLSRLYERSGDIDAAVRVLKESIDANSRDKETHYRLGILLMLTNAPYAEIVQHFRASFTPGDARHGSQFWYARALYLHGDYALAATAFAQLAANNDIDASTKKIHRGEVPGKRACGAVARLEGSYAFLRKDGDGATVFASQRHSLPDAWSEISVNMRVSFRVAFNYRGLVGLDVRREG